MGWIVLSEPITWLQIGGMGLVMGAMWLLVRNDAPNKQQDPNTTKQIDPEGANPLS
jgi:drug/metabolite transporter (DMT)-like permease